MGTTELTPATPLNENESCEITATLFDALNEALNKASILTLTMSLFDAKTDAIINSRDEVNIKDANGGTVATDGTLTLRLDPADNVVVGTSRKESHICRITWTWNSGAAVMTGVENFRFDVNADLKD